VSTDNCTIDLGCKVRNPLFHSGTSQRERLLTALNPDFIKADEHTLEDLLIFAAEYSKQLNYYTTSNVISGNDEIATWRELIETDLTVILAKISVTKTSQIKLAFEDKVRKLLVNYGSNLNNNDKEDFRAVFQEILNTVKLLDGWYNLQANNNELRPIIEEFITQRLSEQIEKLISYDKGAQVTSIPTSPAPDYTVDLSIYSFLSNVWGIVPASVAADQSIYVGLNEENQIGNAISEIRLIFNVVFQAVSQIISLSREMLTKSLESPEHKPHIALFITFLRLFRHAQDDLNKFTGKHLDYYYKEVLKLTEKEAQPDRVFLIFELAQNVEQHLIAQETEFEAGDDALGNEVTFTSIRDVVLNKGSLAGLNSVYAELDSDGNVSNVFSAAGADTKNGLGEEPVAEGKYWPLLGESQIGKAAEDRTMQDATIGFAVSSPLFFLKSGVRKINIILSPSNNVEVTVKDLNYFETDILNSLRIYLSTEDGFIIKKPNRVFADVVPFGDKYRISTFQIEILLNKKDPEITSYNKDVQGGTFETTWPLLKLVFDNREASISAFGLKKYGSEEEYNKSNKKQISTYYTLRDGGIYKLISDSATPTKGQDPLDTTGTVWERIENVEDLVADMDGNSLEYNPTHYYETGEFAKINGQYKIANRLLNSSGSGNTLNWDLLVTETSYGYKYIKNTRLQNLVINVDVTGISNLILHSEDAALDPNKPFTPFGSNPDIGTHFYIGNTEIFQKQLSSFTFKIVWDKLPDKNFGAYYVGYEPGDNPTATFLNNDSFNATIEILDKGVWSSLLPNIGLFETASDNAPKSERNISIGEASLSAISRDPYMDSFDTFTQGLSKGFIRFTLQKTSDIYGKAAGAANTSPIRAFGHKERPLLFTERIITKSKVSTPVKLPEEPYTPLIKECTIDYKSTVTIPLVSTNPVDFKNRVDQVFHIEAFGQNEVHRQLLDEETVMIDQLPQVYLLPQYNDEGVLYIGLDNIAPLENITVLFQFKEGTEDTSIPFAGVVWSYLSQNKWFDLPSVNIAYDGTNKFLQSGIVEIALPEEMTSNNTRLPAGSLWLRLRAEQNTRSINQVLAVKVQSLEVDFANNGNDPERVRKGLPANTIQDLKSRDAEIDSIVQPFASFGGKVKEESNFFYNRVSERLRHKSRAIEIWDYERLVLENFQDVYRTKCLNHTSTIKNITSNNLEELLSTEASPGFVTMVVIPQLKDFVTQEIFEPKVGIATIAAIKDYLLQYISPFIQLEVENPLYERVKAQFEVVFRPGLNKAFYTAKLNEEINQFLAPWAFDSNRDITFGGRLQRSVLINFIEERPYVDFVLHFHLLQQSCIGSDSYKEVDEAQARTSRSVLSSGGVHLITALEKEEVVCDDGIGSMIAERSFVVR
jgi:hypothetical protein